MLHCFPLLIQSRRERHLSWSRMPGCVPRGGRFGGGARPGLSVLPWICFPCPPVAFSVGAAVYAQPHNALIRALRRRSKSTGAPENRPAAFATRAPTAPVCIGVDSALRLASCKRMHIHAFAS